MQHPAHSTYHSLLRMSALTLGLMLLFTSGMIHPVTKQLTASTEQYLANAISVGAAVKPNELNTITAALTAQQQELNTREAEIRQRELALGLAPAEVEAEADYTTFILSVVLFILLVLIVLNYILDYTRMPQPVAKEEQVAA